MNKITFFLMSEKGYSVLEAFISRFSPNYIDQVICSKDPNVANDYFEGIKSLCIKNDIQFINRRDFHKIRTNYSFAISWQWLIHHDSKIIIIHDSLLPKYRGFAPLVNSLINGESEIGATAIFANSEFDKGEIILQKKITISYPIKIKYAIELISNLYAKMVIEIADNIIHQKKLNATKQDEKNASYSLWRDEDDYRINWNHSSNVIKRFIDALSLPYKGAFSFLNEMPIRILDSIEVADVVIENRTPGKVLFIHDNFPVVVCGTGLLKITIAIDDVSKESVLPINKFRSRFN